MTPAIASPWVFFVSVYCWTWSFWFAAAALGTSVETTPGSVLLRLGLLGPMLGGIAFTYLTRDRQGRREYWSRVIALRRIPATWYLVILLFAPALMTLALLLDVASGGSVAPALRERASSLVAAPAVVIAFAFRVLINGPLPEELGWRGYVLDRLQTRWNALTSSLVLGAVWALWHLPLFFFPGMIHCAQGVGSPWFWQFMGSVVPMAIILTWIFSNTRRSTLAAILFHFVCNATYDLGNVTARTNLYATLLWLAAAVAVVAWWGPGTLTRQGRRRGTVEAETAAEIRQTPERSFPS